MKDVLVKVLDGKIVLEPCSDGARKIMRDSFESDKVTVSRDTLEDVVNELDEMGLAVCYE